MTRCVLDRFEISLATNIVCRHPQITRIKEKVEEQSGVPPPQQRLIFGGRQMYVLPIFTQSMQYIHLKLSVYCQA